MRASLQHLPFNDPAGAISTSTPIGVRVVANPSGVQGWGLYLIVKVSYQP